MISRQIQQELEEYRSLHQKTTLDGAQALTEDQLIRLENLYQRAINGELDPGMEPVARGRLIDRRISKLQQRIHDGLPPYEKTLFNNCWVWNGKNGYDWNGPRLIDNREVTLIPPQAVGPEGTPQSKI